jgi:hypothetical protein
MFLGIITLILLIFCFTYGVSLIGSGLFFIGVIFGLMGIIVINVIILKVMYNFVFNINSNFKKIFYIFIIGFFLMGIGLGISFTAYLSFGVDNDVVSMEYDTYDETLKYDDKMILDFIDCSNVEIVYEDREDIKIELLFYNKGEYGYIDEYNMFYEGVEYVVYTDRYYDYRENFVDQFNYAIGLIKDKKRIDKIESVYIDDIKIYVSEDNYKKLKNNYDKVYG